MKKIKFFIVAAISSLLMMTSCNYLDVSDYFEDTLNIDSVFHKKVNVEKFLWGAAALLPDESNIFKHGYYPSIMGSDEGFTMWESSYYPQRLPIDEITADNMGSMNIWTAMYQVIRKANTIFTRIDECKDLTAQDKREIVGYAHFLRGYAYYFLLMSYGPILNAGDEVYATNLDPEAYQKYRSTYDESVEYICNELETAASYIPPVVPINVFGRPTKGAAYGLIARVRVYAASPLYNGGQASRTYFSNFKRKSDGVYYVSQEYDEKKWAVAAAACKRVMEMNYSLHTIEKREDTPELPLGITYDQNYYKDWPEGAAGIDHYRSYAEMFNGETLGFKNTEYVFGKNSGAVRDGTDLAFPAQFGGWNCMSIPQKIIDNYKMIDGYDINNSSDLYPYTEEGFTTTDRAFSGYTIRPNVNNMYLNREPRFYASIGFSGCLWPMNSTTENGKFMQQAFYSKDGNSGSSAATQGDKRNYPITGYVPKKYIHQDDAWSGTNSAVLSKSFPIVRYADILLMYAECLNNLTQSHTVSIGETEYTFTRDKDEIRKAFNQVRYRSGLPGLTENQLNNADAFFEALKVERMVEFLHEGLRYYDVRRWGIVKEEEAKPIMGMDTDKTERGGYYNRVICNYSTVRNRVFKDKMILLPIDRQEIKRVLTLDQNPGWEN
ncbi:MAG: RagB/SusD family nutrient uptake outer membrane protein [Prevotella sp.]|jgi:hypothetical protein|nr:RagB/SusD family nutrient uptake outer membrane protein [Prevotella sp.]